MKVCGSTAHSCVRARPWMSGTCRACARYSDAWIGAGNDVLLGTSQGSGDATAGWMVHCTSRTDRGDSGCRDCFVLWANAGSRVYALYGVIYCPEKGLYCRPFGGCNRSIRLTGRLGWMATYDQHCNCHTMNRVKCESDYSRRGWAIGSTWSKSEKQLRMSSRKIGANAILRWWR